MRGVGEGGAIIGAPTLVNAIADALAPFGEIPLRLPLTPTRLLSLIEGRDLAAKVEHPQLEEASAATAAADTPATVPAPVDQPVPAAPAPEPAAPVGPLIDGDWKMVLSTPVGPQAMIGRFETDGTALSGYLKSEQGSMGFTGTVEGNRLKFDLKVDKPMKITLKYDITIDGARLTGKVKMGIFGTAKLVGERG
jgi:carbon-monoxide dehydrogenase large subunit